MDYQALYYKIINIAKERGYGDEKHHILPRSLGGSNDDENLVSLTYREHFVCHRLLAKMYPLGSIERKKMVYALWWMCKTRKRKTHITSHMYKSAREEFIQNMPTRQPGYKERYRANYLAGKYNHDPEKIAEGMRRYTSSLTEDEMTERMRKSVQSCDHEKRARAISRGKASQYEITDGDNVYTVWTYEDVKGITGYPKNTLRYHMKHNQGMLPDGKHVRYRYKYGKNN